MKRINSLFAIASLAGMMAMSGCTNGPSSGDSKLIDQMQSRMDAMETRMSTMQSKMDAMEAHMTEMMGKGEGKTSESKPADSQTTGSKMTGSKMTGGKMTDTKSQSK